MTGVPTSCPTGSHTAVVGCAQYLVEASESAACANSAGSPTPASAFAIASSMSRMPSTCICSPRGRVQVECHPRSAGLLRRDDNTHWLPGLDQSRYSSGISRPSFRTANDITCHCTSTSRTCSTSSIHREVIQAQGHIGSNQKSALVIFQLSTRPGQGAAGPVNCLPP